MRSQWVIMALLSAVLLVMSGCGVAKKAGEKATGVKVEDGGSKLTVTGEDGKKVEMSVEEKKIPKDFPLPVLSGWKSDGMVETNAEGRKGWIGSMIFTGDLADTGSRYKETLEKMGLTISTATIDDGESILNFEGMINGKLYGGIITFSKGDEAGTNSVAFMFGETK